MEGEKKEPGGLEATLRRAAEAAALQASRPGAPAGLQASRSGSGAAASMEATLPGSGAAASMEATLPGGAAAASMEATLAGGGAAASMEATLPGGAGYSASIPSRSAPGYSQTSGIRPLGQGDRLGQFVVLDELGAGAMGVVLAAHDPDLDRRVAIKLVKPRSDQAPTEEAQIRMLREAQSMAKVTHPNVVTVHQVGFERNQLFIAMEFIDGRTLRAWAKERPRRLMDVLEVYRAAGEGLIAAHTVGLVHRDFKPDNVLIGHDGRVVVTDFGLVSIAGAAATASPMMMSSGRMVVSDADLSQTLTATGTAMGTPAYMAAEQHRGHEVDARADQFAFCVSLWEALYGLRPFHRQTVPEVVRATLNGVPDPPPDPPAIVGTVPRSIRRALERGLRPRPSDRWPDMRTLLEKLRYDQGATARIIVIGVGGALALGAIGLGTYGFATRGGGAEQAPACDLGPGKVGEIWNGERQGLLATSLRATKSAAADDAVDGLGKRLDAWGDDWASAYLESCEATRVHGEQSEMLLDRRMHCLERNRAGVRTLIDRLINAADIEAVSQSVATASAVTSVDHCRADDLAAWDGERLAPEQLQQAAAVREELDAARIELRLGHLDDAVTALEALVPKAEGIGDSLLLAEVLMYLGQAMTKAGKAVAAEPILRRAAKEAGSAGDPAVEAECWLSLVDTVGSYLGDPNRAQGILTGAESAVERADERSLHGAFARAKGSLLYMTGEVDEAEVALRQALDLFDGDDPESSRDRFTTYNSLAALLGDVGKPEEALVAYEKGLSEAKKYFGPTHPTLSIIYNNRAMQYRVLQQREKAREGHLAALDVLRKSVGEEHQWVAVAYEGLGILDQEEGKLDDAMRNHQMALTIRTQVLGPDNPQVASSQHNLASILFAQGDVEQAVQLWVAAREVWVKLYGPKHAQIAAIDQNLGMAFYVTNDLEAALRWYTSAADTTEALYGPGHPGLVPIELGLAETQLLRKEYRPCREHTDRGIRLSEGSQQVAVPVRAGLFSAKGWCVLEEGNAEEALKLFEKGAELFDGNPLGDLGRAQALAALGRTDEARAVAQAARPKADDNLKARLNAFLDAL